MSEIDTVRSSTALRHAGIKPASALADALDARAAIFTMTQQAEDAVLQPADPGGWPHALRAALAARIATLNKLEELSSRYAEMVVDEHYRPVTDPGFDGTSLGLAHVLSFMDAVAVCPRDVDNGDIGSLQDHAVSDADIVRLAELNAFMAYQVRLVSGLRLLGSVCT